MPAAHTFIEMAAERCGAAALYGGQHFQVQPAQPGTIAFDESPACAADDIGQFQERPVHLFVVLGEKSG